MQPDLKDKREDQGVNNNMPQYLVVIGSQVQVSLVVEANGHQQKLGAIPETGPTQYSTASRKLIMTVAQIRTLCQTVEISRMTIKILKVFTR